MAVNTKTVKVPIGIRKALWAKITAEPDAAHPTYDTTILDLGAAAVKGTLAITTATLSIYGDDTEQLRDEAFCLRAGRRGDDLLRSRAERLRLRPHLFRDRGRGQRKGRSRALWRIRLSRANPSQGQVRGIPRHVPPPRLRDRVLRKIGRRDPRRQHHRAEQRGLIRLLCRRDRLLACPQGVHRRRRGDLRARVAQYAVRSDLTHGGGRRGRLRFQFDRKGAVYALCEI